MESAEYKEYYIEKEGVWWKKLLDVQRPYRNHVNSLNLGFVLDVGCGLGRNLGHLKGHGVGVDINAEMVEVARKRGITAFTPDTFEKSEFGKEGRFDSLLSAHVLEHMKRDEAVALLKHNLKYVRKGGRVVLITPQEKGYRSDPTHVTFLDLEELKKIGESAGLVTEKTYSFPFPRFVGKVFPHNESVYIGTKA